MANKTRGTSFLPLIMGIIGSGLQLPGSVCAGACAAGMSSSANSQDAGNTFLIIGLLSALIGLISGLFGKKLPVFSGVGLLIATVLSGITLVTFNFFGLAAAILFLIGAIFAFVQKKEGLPVQTTQ